MEKDIAEELFLGFWVSRVLPNTDYANFCYHILDKKEKENSIISFSNLIHKVDFVKLLGNSGLVEFPKNNDEFLSEKSFLKIQTTFIELQENWQWENMGSVFCYQKNRSTFVKLQKFFFSFAVLLPQ